MNLIGCIFFNLFLFFNMFLTSRLNTVSEVYSACLFFKFWKTYFNLLTVYISARSIFSLLSIKCFNKIFYYVPKLLIKKNYYYYLINNCYLRLSLAVNLNKIKLGGNRWPISPAIFVIIYYSLIYYYHYYLICTVIVL